MHLVDTSWRALRDRLFMSKRSLGSIVGGGAMIGLATVQALSMAMSAGISRPLRSGSPRISEFEIIAKESRLITA